MQVLEARTEALVQAAEAEAQRARGPIRLMMLARLQEIGTKPATNDSEAISWWVARTLRLSNHQKLQVQPLPSLSTNKRNDNELKHVSG